MFCFFYTKQLTMITGDNPLTACHVARELRLTRREIVVLSPPENTNNHGNVPVIGSKSGQCFRSKDMVFVIR